MQIGRKLKQWYYNWKYPHIEMTYPYTNWEVIAQHLDHKIRRQTLNEFSLKDAIVHDNGKFVNFVAINPGRLSSKIGKGDYLVEICLDNGQDMWDECVKLSCIGTWDIEHIVEKINGHIHLLKMRYNVQT